MNIENWDQKWTTSRRHEHIWQPETLQWLTLYQVLVLKYNWTDNCECNDFGRVMDVCKRWLSLLRKGHDLSRGSFWCCYECYFQERDNSIRPQVPVSRDLAFGLGTASTLNRNGMIKRVFSEPSLMLLNTVRCCQNTFLTLWRFTASTAGLKESSKRRKEQLPTSTHIGEFGYGLLLSTFVLRYPFPLY